MIAPDDQGYPPSAPPPEAQPGQGSTQTVPATPRRGEQLDQDWMDRVLGRTPSDRPRQAPARPDGRSGPATPPPEDRSRAQESRPTQ